MNTLIKLNIAVWLSVLVLSMPAYAERNVNNNNCNGRGSCAPGGGGNEQRQSQAQSQRSTNINVLESRSRSSANAGASSNSGGNTLSTGDSRSSSRSRATGGTATATGGQSMSGGNTQSVTSSENVNTSVKYDNDYAVSSPASLFIQACQRGMSGQLESGGFSVAQSDQFCDYLRLAAVMRDAYEWEMRDCKCEGVCSTEIATVELTCSVSAQAHEYLALYHENLGKANSLIDSTDETAVAERVAGQLTIPIATILALIWIL